MKKIIFFFLLILITPYGISQSSFNLKEALNYAAENNNDFKNSQLDLLIADEKVKESVSTGLPKIQGSIGFRNYIDIPTTVLPANTFNPNAPSDELIGLQFGTSINATGTIRLDQMIFSATYISGLKAAKTYKNLMRIVLEKSKMELLELTTNAYYSVLIFNENYRLLSQSHEKLETIQKESLAMVNEGVLEKINTDQINLLIIQLKNQLSEIEILQKNALSTLKYVMGFPQDSALILKEELDEFLLEDWNLAPITNNPSDNIDYLILLENVKLNELNVKMNKATSIPSLSGFFSHQQVALRNEFNLFSDNPWYPSTFWGIKVSVPIFDSREQSAKTNQSKLELEKAKNSLTNSENSFNFLLNQTMSDYNINLLTHKNSQENLLLSQKILNNTLIKFKEGIANSMEVAQAQNQELLAQNQLLQTNFKLLLSKVKLDRLLNKLTL